MHGEVGLAVVVPTPGTVPDADADADALRAALRERLAGFKVPQEVRYVTGLPTTASGEIRKPALRQTYVLTEEDA